MNFQKHCFQAQQISIRYLISTNTRIQMSGVTSQEQVVGCQICYLISSSILQPTGNLSSGA
jgi:hypothetical protein